jgi:hypothetical protein
VSGRLDEAIVLLDRIGDATNRALLRTRRRFVQWLRDDDPGATLDDGQFDEAAVLRELQATSVSKSMLAHFQSLRLMTRYFSGQYVEACQISKVLDELLVFVPGMMTVAEHAMFQSLSITAAWDQLPAAERASLEARLDAQLRTLETWARNCPHNFRAVHLLVSAEHARVRGDAAAAGLYEQATAQAQGSGFVHVEAIASELAMGYWEARDPARAAAARVSAINAYERWGATRKLRALATTSGS